MPLKLNIFFLFLFFVPNALIAACDDQRFDSTASTLLKDKTTGLVWKRCFVKSDGNCDDVGTGNAKVTWSQANSAAQGDWRLPDIAELSSLVRKDCDAATDPAQVIPNVLSNYVAATQASFWTATQNARATTLAWAVDFTVGGSISTDKATLAHNVLLVRDWKQ